MLGWIEPTEAIRLMAGIGIILLLFEVGLETDVKRLVSTGLESIVVAFAGFILPFLFGFGLAYGLFDSVAGSLFIGGTCRDQHRHHRAGDRKERKLVKRSGNGPDKYDGSGKCPFASPGGMRNGLYDIFSGKGVGSAERVNLSCRTGHLQGFYKDRGDILDMHG